jgi:hypothetical protein
MAAILTSVAALGGFWLTSAGDQRILRGRRCWKPPTRARKNIHSGLTHCSGRRAVVDDDRRRAFAAA